MGSDFFDNLVRLELLGFFSGFPLLYALVVSLAGNKRIGQWARMDIRKLLPLSYALVGTLYLGLQLRNLYANYTHGIPLFRDLGLWHAWALLSLLFWIPRLRQYAILSLLHSLVFFFLLAKELFVQLLYSPNDSIPISIEMKLYTDSLLLNLVAWAIVLLIAFFFRRKKIGTS